MDLKIQLGFSPLKITPPDWIFLIGFSPLIYTKNSNQNRLLKRKIKCFPAHPNGGMFFR